MVYHTVLELFLDTKSPVIMVGILQTVVHHFHIMVLTMELTCVEIQQIHPMDVLLFWLQLAQAFLLLRTAE